MQDMQLMLLSITAGALIGLLTNWLAIRMLFRPWKEKKLLGKRLPLTPGLIPRRQDELADKLGEIVQKELLTPEGVAKAVKRVDVEFAVKRSAVHAISDTLNEAPTAGELLVRLFGEDTLVGSKRWLTERAVAFLRSEAGRRRLETMADSLYDHLRGSLSTGEVRRELAQGFAKPLYLQLTQGNLSWQDALPESLRTLIGERLEAQLDPLLQGAADWMQDPAVVEAIAKMLQEKVENIPLIGPMAKGFLTPDRVASDIVPRLQNVILSTSTRHLVESKLADMLGKFWSRPVAGYLGRMSPDDLNGLLDSLLGNVLDRLFRDREESRASFRDLLVNGLLAGANEAAVGDLLDRILEGLFQWNLRDLYIGHTEETDRLITKAWRYLRGEIIESVPEVLDALNVREIVREQVASYPIPTLEKLILSVVHRELRLITVLGGVLGAIIGFVQALILI